MKVALDLDSTLARTCDVAFELIGEPDYSYDDIEDWSWGLEEFGRARYLNALWHAWTIRPDEIEPFEPNVGPLTEQLYTAVDQLDIVTKHPDGMLGIDKGKRQWLDEHNVVYDEYRSVDREKSELGYDIYIDDNPNLVDTDATVMVYDQPYNQDVEGFARIKSLSEAYTILSNCKVSPMSDIAVTVHDWGDEWTYTEDDTFVRSITYTAERATLHDEPMSDNMCHRVSLNGLTDIDRAPWLRAKRPLPVAVTFDDTIVEFEADVSTEVKYRGETVYDIELRETGVVWGEP